MKKILAIALFATTAHANVAPTLRGEYQPMPLPNAINLSQSPIAGLPTPVVHVSNITTLPTILIPQTTDNNGQIDATLIDDFIDDVSPNARHYPPNFPNRTTLHLTRENVKHLSAWLEPYATSPNASFEVLLRAAKINGMGRNLDLGSDYGVRASNHIAKALRLSPNHAEANFLYGMMLSEGGGFKEGKKYLEKAANLGYLEAEQSLAQTDLLTDNRPSAIARLQLLTKHYPNHPQLQQQLTIAQTGGYYLWDIKDNDIKVKPIHR